MSSPASARAAFSDRPGGTEKEWIIDDVAPPPTRVTEYHYLRGNLGYRPIDQEATLAA